MREIKEALTKDADGKFPAKYADMDWDGMNMQPHKIAWQDMDMGQRYDLLLHVLNESIWSLEPSAKWDEPSDSQKLALEFVKDEERQAIPDFRSDAVGTLMTRLESFGIAWIAEATPWASRDQSPPAGQHLPSPGELAEDRGGSESPDPDCGHDNGRGR